MLRSPFCELELHDLISNKYNFDWPYLKKKIVFGRKTPLQVQPQIPKLEESASLKLYSLFVIITFF
jgi:hypothetical protein